MDATIMYKDIVSKYFEAWLNHDVCLLKEIFDPSAKYIIRNKHYAYCGIEEITDYWIRNKKRQKDLSLRWKILGYEENHCTASFQANFFDIEENEPNTINGIMDISLTNNNQISIFSEEYIKN